ncbi:MAG: hypothetical protein AAB864_02345 [Patescibacteria group bacterium]
MTKCARCPNEIPEEQVGRYTIDKDTVCEDCYYTDFSIGIDKHPIVNPTRRPVSKT